ncbi:kinesin-like protein KIN-4C [Vespula squamosa]|uniref:Kinesin-like protein KIN-4C n=1 Tax=Vespula squamosa TaxID=30214 RepID=A0ABD2AK05_VESSQ
MPRVKRKEKKVVQHESKQISIAIQTDDIDNVEIIRLQEQLKMLQLENDTLRKHADSSLLSSRNLSGKINSDTVQSPKKINETLKGDPQVIKSSIKQKICTCKGNCSSKICGCVKHQRKCGQTCKCNNQTCQNQESENKENIKTMQYEVLNQTQKLEEISVKSETIHQNLFSPVGTENEIKLDDIQFEEISFDSKKKLTFEDENSQEKEPVVKKALNQKKKKNKQQHEDKDDIPEVNTSFDPMKPKRQLPRTPPHASINSESDDVLTNVETPTEKIEQKDDIIPEVLNQENVDLDKLSIELVKCNKCKRKFYPWRVEVHESACHRL